MLHHHRRGWARAVALLLAVLLILPAFPAGAASSSELKNKLAGLESRQGEVKSRLKELENEKDSALKKKELIDEEISVLQEQIDLLEEAIEALAGEIDDTNREIERLTDEIDALTTRITIKERERKDLYEAFKTRIRVMHEEDLTSYVGILFGAKSVADLVERVEAVANILTADRNTMKKLEDMQAEIEADRESLAEDRTEREEKEAELEAAKAEKEENKAILDGKMAELVERQTAARNLVNSINGSISQNRSLLESLEEQQKNVEDEIREAVKAEEAARKKAEEEAAKKKAEEEAAKRKAEEEAAKKKAEEETAKDSETTSEKTSEKETEKTSEKTSEKESEKTSEKTSEKESEKTSEKETEKTSEKTSEKESGSSSGSGGSGSSKVSLSWPLPGRSRISSGFGYRTHPVTGRRGSFHSGIDIPAPAGTKIQCAAAGTVIKATYNVAYGNMIVVDHGNGISTMYAHMRSRALYKVGDKVSRGTVLGYVGTTGWSTGNHLHFSVLKNGDYVSPLKYVSP